MVSRRPVARPVEVRLHGSPPDTGVDERVVELAEGSERPRTSFDDEEMVAAVAAVISHGIPVRGVDEVGRGPRYEPGDTVRTKIIRIRWPGREHTRLPAYAQDKVGVVEILHPPQPLGDDILAGRESTPEFVYSVRFRAGDLWSNRCSSESVNVDVWESYMERLGDS